MHASSESRGPLTISRHLVTEADTLARGMLRGLGFPGRVKSPSYTLVELYTVSRLDLYHFDFYRFDKPEEWTDAGFRDYFRADTVCVVEWPEKAQGLLPHADLRIDLSMAGSGRNIVIVADTEAGKRCLATLSG